MVASAGTLGILASNAMGCRTGKASQEKTRTSRKATWSTRKGRTQPRSRQPSVLSELTRLYARISNPPPSESRTRAREIVPGYVFVAKLGSRARTGQ